MLRRPLIIAALFAAATPLGFAWFTNHAWEDYYITLRASRNLAEGNGLVFNVGERLHTFTSPLGVLVPAFFTWLVGPGHEQLALWLFRGLSAGLLGISAVLGWRRFDSLRYGGVARVVFFGLVFADSKLVDFSINGMETAILVTFVLWLWSELERPEGPRAGRIALSCAGLMWTRPDAFILGAVLLIPHFCFRQRADGASRIPWRPLLSGLVLGGLLYVPWFAWAWWYYGTPVPHTIVAKSQVTLPINVMSFVLNPWRTLTGESLIQDIFLPAYWFYGKWPAGLPHAAHLLSALAVFAWLIPGLPAPTRRVSLGLFLGSFYVCAIILFPWYSPPWTVLAALTIAGGVDQLMRWAAARRWPALASATRVAALLTVTGQFAVLLGAAWEMRVQQRLIENETRREIGLWLKANAEPGDTVFMECLGYIGYYSEMKTYDYPGLSSPEVVAAIRGGSRRFTEVIDRLRPTWLVLRPFEIADASKPENAVLREYEIVRRWDVRAKLDAVPLLPGRHWLEHDAEFTVFRHRP